MLPFVVGEVAHGRTDQVGGQRAVAAAVIAVAGHAPRQIDRAALGQERSLATSGGGGPTGLLSMRKATKPPAITPSIARKISRETDGSMPVGDGSSELESSVDKGLDLASLRLVSF